MSAPFMPDSTVQPITSLDIADAVEIATEKMRSLAECVRRLALEDAPIAAFGDRRRVIEMIHATFELSVDGLRSTLVEALSGQAPRGYVNDGALRSAILRRIDANEARAGGRLATAPPSDEAGIDASLCRSQRAHGASLLSSLPPYLPASARQSDATREAGFASCAGA